MTKPRAVLVLGATGMLGCAVLRTFAKGDSSAVVGTARSTAAVALLPAELRTRVECGIDVHDMDQLIDLFDRVRPELVVNCVGLIKQRQEGTDALEALPINAMFPHQLLRLSKLAGARLIHVSTDCVFDGSKGMYTESDVATARDVYGLSKYLGELHDPGAITLRTSIVGHELGSSRGLVEWFLSQSGSVKGYRRAVFSGLSTAELARVMRDVIAPRSDLHGLYHVSADPITKFELLQLISREYGKAIEIVPDDALVIDRSLDSARFRKQVGYAPPSWPQLVRGMREFG